MFEEKFHLNQDPNDFQDQVEIGRGKPNKMIIADVTIFTVHWEIMVLLPLDSQYLLPFHLFQDLVSNKSDCAKTIQGPKWI